MVEGFRCRSSGRCLGDSLLSRRSRLGGARWRHRSQLRRHVRQAVGNCACLNAPLLRTACPVRRRRLDEDDREPSEPGTDPRSCPSGRSLVGVCAASPCQDSRPTTMQLPFISASGSSAAVRRAAQKGQSGAHPPLSNGVLGSRPFRLGHGLAAPAAAASRKPRRQGPAHHGFRRARLPCSACLPARSTAASRACAVGIRSRDRDRSDDPPATPRRKLVRLDGRYGSCRCSLRPGSGSSQWCVA